MAFRLGRGNFILGVGGGAVKRVEAMFEGERRRRSKMELDEDSEIQLKMCGKQRS